VQVGDVVDVVSGAFAGDTRTVVELYEWCGVPRAYLRDEQDGDIVGTSISNLRKRSERSEAMSEARFRVGDRVRCINDTCRVGEWRGHIFTEDSSLVVSDVGDANGHQWLLFAGHEHKGSLASSRFELVSRAEEPIALRPMKIDAIHASAHDIEHGAMVAIGPDGIPRPATGADIPLGVAQESIPKGEPMRIVDGKVWRADDARPVSINRSRDILDDLIEAGGHGPMSVDVQIVAKARVIAWEARTNDRNGQREGEVTIIVDGCEGELRCPPHALRRAGSKPLKDIASDIYESSDVAMLNASLDAANQRANRLGDECGSLKTALESVHEERERLRVKKFDLESDLRGKDRTIAALRAKLLVAGVK